MAKVYLHDHHEFINLIKILSEETGIDPGLIEKDYWIMHVLHQLGVNGYKFEMKGGTSLSKGFNVIERFSEDIDIHIHPPNNLKLNVNPKNTKPAILSQRKEFYDQLAAEINFDGIQITQRDHAFDSKNYLSGGIRLKYKNLFPATEGIKEGILLEAGFDKVSPNSKITISSWVYDRAISKIQSEIIDNRAIDVTCYNPEYTFVEKLQTIATKFRIERNSGKIKNNLLRQYYDVAMLLKVSSIQKFIGTSAYKEFKKSKFPKTDYEIPINKNEAFLLSESSVRSEFIQRYQATKGLYFKGQIEFEELLGIIHMFIDKL